MRANTYVSVFDYPNRQTFLVRKPALCAQVRGTFADADTV